MAHYKGWVGKCQGKDIMTRPATPAPYERNRLSALLEATVAVAPAMLADAAERVRDGAE